MTVVPGRVPVVIRYVSRSLWEACCNTTAHNADDLKVCVSTENEETSGVRVLRSYVKGAPIRTAA